MIVQNKESVMSVYLFGNQLLTKAFYILIINFRLIFTVTTFIKYNLNLLKVYYLKENIVNILLLV